MKITRTEAEYNMVNDNTSIAKTKIANTRIQAKSMDIIELITQINNHRISTNEQLDCARDIKILGVLLTELHVKLNNLTPVKVPNSPPEAIKISEKA